jgi:uncharacterized RDD family membrane protein YckC
MKCPKCGYLGYERVDRCRNCGYEFSLTPGSDPTPELRLRDSRSVPQPLDDLELVDAAAAPGSGPFDELRSQPRTPETPGQNGLAELPLFGPPITDDVPLITKASPPRAPLSVRRATPEVPRLRSEPRAPLLDWSDPGPSEAKEKPRAIDRHAPRAAQTPNAATDARDGGHRAVRRTGRDKCAAGASEPAGLGPRAFAALIDVGLLALVDLVVVYFTLKICRLGVSDVVLLPKAPLVAFLLLQNGGYFVALTTTGQTLGKMIAGLRVLADESGDAPDLGRSLLRALFWIVLALPAGLGLLSAAFSRDGRGLHDRFAGTRVVRTSPPPLLAGASARQGA